MAKLVFITGATGSIGQALAQHYAVKGYDLILHGRNEQKLKALIRQCQACGVKVTPFVSDFTNSDQVIDQTSLLLKKVIPDIFIANAGVNINHGMDNAGERLIDIEILIDINIKSTLLMCNMMVNAMRERGQGQLVLMSSLAAFFGLPITPTYSASKAAVKAYGEALRGWLSDSGIGVTVVMPGYIKSDMCDEMPGPKPFLLTPERAAQIIYRGIADNRARISFPFPLNLGTWFLAVLPPSLSLWILKRLNYIDE